MIVCRPAPSRSQPPKALGRAVAASLLAMVLLIAVACGEEPATSSEGDLGVGEACAGSGQCASGLLCIGGLCKDPNAPANNDPNNDPNNGFTNNDPNNDPNNTPNNDPNNTPGPVCGDNICAPEETESCREDCGDPDNPRPRVLTGGVSLFEVNITANFLISIRRGNIGAAFVEPQPEDPPIQSFGECDLINVSQGGPEAFGYSAGDISVAINGQSHVLTPMDGGGGSTVYPTAFGEENEDAYRPGAAIMVSATGGHVGAFMGSLTAPQEHVLSSPPADAMVSGTGDLALRWTGDGSGSQVAVAISPLDAGFNFLDGRGLNCVPGGGDSGTLVVPAAAMRELRADKLAIVVIKVDNVALDVDGDDIVLNTTYAAGNVVNLR